MNTTPSEKTGPLFGMREPKPARGFPPGRVKFILRPDNWVKAAVRTADGLRVFPVCDAGDAWEPYLNCEFGANRRAEAGRGAPMKELESKWTFDASCCVWLGELEVNRVPCLVEVCIEISEREVE